MEQLYIKNMVCSRCKAAVQQVLEQAGLQVRHIQLGEVLVEGHLPAPQRAAVAARLEELGFELIHTAQGRLIEQIKTAIIGLVHYDHTERPEQVTLSKYLSAKLHKDYSVLSQLFSQVEGMTIEQYTILQKAERVKELLRYDELSLAEIALQMNYSSPQHLSTQFRKVTGLTPTQFRRQRELPRRPLDGLS